MKISIVTVSFNQCAYLKKAMDSVLDQGYPELEYIVVDPGSTDGSRELIQSYGSRVSKAVLEPDRGAADGLNKGFALATGDIFGYLNSDDLLMPGSLQTVADYFHKHPECDLVMGNGRKIDGDGKRIAEIRARDFTVRRHLHGGSRWLQQATFFRRDTFLCSPQFNLDNRTCWDGELFVQMVNQGAKVGYIDSDIAAFRIHATSISGTGRMWDTYQKDMQRIFKDVTGRDWRISDELWRFSYWVEGILIRFASWFRPSARRNTV